MSQSVGLGLPCHEALGPLAFRGALHGSAPKTCQALQSSRSRLPSLPKATYTGSLSLHVHRAF